MARILIVEDDRGILECLVELVGLTHQVVGVGSATEALKVVSKDAAWDLLMIDVVMPVMYGPALVEEMERIGVKLPVLYMTAGRSGPPGGAPCLFKPFDLHEMEAMISRSLKKRGFAISGHEDPPVSERCP